MKILIISLSLFIVSCSSTDVKDEYDRQKMEQDRKKAEYERQQNKSDKSFDELSREVKSK